jgi:hypothetical protein
MPGCGASTGARSSVDGGGGASLTNDASLCAVVGFTAVTVVVLVTVVVSANDERSDEVVTVVGSVVGDEEVSIGLGVGSDRCAAKCGNSVGPAECTTSVGPSRCGTAVGIVDVWFARVGVGSVDGCAVADRRAPPSTLSGMADATAATAIAPRVPRAPNRIPIVVCAIGNWRRARSRRVEHDNSLRPLQWRDSDAWRWNCRRPGRESDLYLSKSSIKNGRRPVGPDIWAQSTGS